MADALTVVRTYLNGFEGELAKSALEAAGITAMLHTDDCGGLRPHLWMGGIQLVVRAEDAARAAEVLDEIPVVEDDLPGDDFP